MKKTILFIAGLLMLIAGRMNAQSDTIYNSAVSYNDYIVSVQFELGDAIKTFSSLFGAEELNEKNIREGYSILVMASENCLRKVENLKDFRGNTALRDASIELFRFYERTIKIEYKELMEIQLLVSPSESDFERWEEINKTVTDNEKPFDEKFANAQTEFAREFNFTLEAPETEEE